MYKIILALAFINITSNAGAQQIFIDKATVEYEVKTNIKKTIETGFFEDMIKDQLPQFKTGYYHYTFAENKGIYKFDHWDPNMILPTFLKTSDEANAWYYDYNSGIFNMQKSVAGSNFTIADSISHINWKLENENRVIAGFNCRKAMAIIMDSVYVFAFYTDEITIPGGPCNIHGLPGLILGLTIPRMYTSWIATNVSVNAVDAGMIKPIASKKDYTMATFKTTINSRIKEWVSEDDPDSKNWIAQFYWNLLL
ncbi:MAG: GLPGLI family protein [Bacteroidetes bacterium]|nr:GLPGLI family protein [Bacteroidota bacterium]